MENRFNLIDEPWIPVADHGRVSLLEIFSNPQYRSLGGNPVQKIAVLKLLLAIAQSAATPKDEAEWKALGAVGLAERCLSYLDKWHDRFYLYGERPFLQMPAICKAKKYPFGSAVPQISTGNTTVLSQIQVEREFDDADKAMLIATLSGFSFGGKKADNSVELTPGYGGKLKEPDSPEKSKLFTPKPGPSIGDRGFLHSFILQGGIVESLWINLLTDIDIGRMNMYSGGVGIVPWESMPKGEDCEISKGLKSSLMGRLVPLSRFCLLADDGIHNSEGIYHSGIESGVSDPSMAVNFSGKIPQALHADPEKRPWRELTSLLEFLEQNKSQGFRCTYIYYGLDRVVEVADYFSIWSGGLKVFKHSTGEQYVTDGDFVESEIFFHRDVIGRPWFEQLKIEVGSLDKLSNDLWGKVVGYFKTLKADGGGKIDKTHAGKMGNQARNLFWQLCERDFQSLVYQCDQTDDAAIQRNKLRKRFSSYVHQTYDKFCPRETARQLDAWAKCRPNNSKYLKQEV